MSGERQSELRFSLGSTAAQIVLVGALAVGFAYMAFQYGFHFEEISDGRHSGRYGWIGELADTHGGKTGVLIWTCFTLLAAWYFWIAGRRFLSSGEAALLTVTGLKVHPTYRRTAEIPFADIFSARIWRESFLITTLTIDVANARPIKIRSNSIEGGKDALKGFAKELNARRAFEDGSREGNGDSYE